MASPFVIESEFVKRRAAAPSFDGLRLLRGATRRAVSAGFAVALLLVFLISPLRLDAWGIHYDMPGGGVFAKAHPGTWVALAALAAGCIVLRRPLQLADVLAARRGLLTFFAVWLFLVAIATAFLQTPVTPVIDVFLLPMAIFFMLESGLARPTRGLALALHVFMAANAALGIVEHVSGWRLTPYPYALYDPRPTALLGHPLSNASLTGAYLLMLTFGGGRDMSRRLLPAAFGLQIFGLIVFDGRAASVMVGLVLIGVATLQTLRFASGLRLRRSTIAAALACVPLAAGLFAVLATSDFLRDFIGRFGSDSGSAAARVTMFRLLSQIPLRQMLLGADPTLVSSLQYQEDIPAGIESFWINFSLQYGLLVGMAFFVGLIWFCSDVARSARRPAGWVLIYFFVLASGSVSLSAKSCLFAQLIAMILIFLRRDAATASAPPNAAGRA